MVNRKGQKCYPESIKLQLKAEHAIGASIKSLHQKYRYHRGVDCARGKHASDNTT